MRKACKSAAAVLVILTAVFIFALPVGADMGGFSVSPVFPENQNPGTRGFFDLRVEAGTRQEIAVDVVNTGEEAIAVSLSLITASTNRNGIVNYTSPGREDVTLLHPFADIAAIAPGYELVTVGAQDSVRVPIFIDVPAGGFDGIVLGSIHALLEITDEQRAAAGMIVNRFAHVVVVRLQENDTVVGADFLLGEVGPELVNHRASIVAEIRNTQPRLSMGAVAHAQIYPAGSDTPIFARWNVNVDFAPNTVFQFSMVDEAGFGLHPGDYLARIQLEHGGVSWDFEREFEIVPTVAEEINVAAVNIQHQLPFTPLVEEPTEGTVVTLGNLTVSIWVIVAAGAGIVLIIALIAVLLITQNKRRAEKENAIQMRMQNLERKLLEGHNG